MCRPFRFNLAAHVDFHQGAALDFEATVYGINEEGEFSATRGIRVGGALDLFWGEVDTDFRQDLPRLV